MSCPELQKALVCGTERTIVQYGVAVFSNFTVSFDATLGNRQMSDFHWYSNGDCNIRFNETNARPWEITGLTVFNKAIRIAPVNRQALGESTWQNLPISYEHPAWMRPAYKFSQNIVAFPNPRCCYSSQGGIADLYCFPRDYTMSRVQCIPICVEPWFWLTSLGAGGYSLNTGIYVHIGGDYGDTGINTTKTIAIESGDVQGGFCERGSVDCTQVTVPDDGFNYDITPGQVQWSLNTLA